ncbi:MAG: hypothetical protein ACI4OH_01405 [Mitsuokella sp.]|uniref:YobI family P-loop NTPase n=1 Tax=Mitsuokella sp. TaxID=2049034 RepID=UPI003EFE1CA1
MYISYQIIKDKINAIIQCFYHQWENYYHRENCTSVYQDLAPRDDLDYDNSEYFKSLYWAIRQDNIKNIALAGPYGSGKSSIIETFICHNLHLHTLKISMATFIENIEHELGIKEEQVNDKNEEKIQIGNNQRIDFQENKIEEWILKQLFYKVSWKKIPQSRFQKIRDISISSRLMIFLLLSLFVVLFVFVFFPKIFDNAWNSILLAGNKFNFNWQVSLALMILITVYFEWVMSYISRYYMSHAKMKKLKFDPIEIENNNSEDNSIFDNNLDEILYFFEQTKYDIIFFEDLDRLHKNKIFVELRQLNELLNNYDGINRKICFVYAVRDDIFTSQDRTKFFDYIIPVIPVINSTNSNEIFLQWTKDNNLENDLSEEYINDISPYIDDMRVLQNIFNEFYLYRKTLEKDGLNLDPEKMMSIVIFKNLYPKDFSDIEKETGIIKQAFLSKSDCIKEAMNQIDNEIEKCNNILQNIDDEELISIKEIKLAMLNHLSNGEGIAYSVNGHNMGEILKDDFNFDNFHSTNNNIQIHYIHNNGSPDWKHTFFDYKSIDKYIKRIEILHKKNNKDIEEMEKSIECKKKDKIKLLNSSLQDIIEKYGIEGLPLQVRENKFLVFLLRNGYLNERYADYINYFQANSISVRDKNFILSVKDREKVRKEEALDNPIKIIERLNVADFKSTSVYNFKLIDSLLSLSDQSNKTIDKINAFIDKLSLLQSDQWNFLDSYIDVSQYKPRLFSLLSERCPNLVHVILLESIPDIRKREYLIDVFEYASLSDLEKMDDKGEVSKYISSQGDILKKLSELPFDSTVAKLDALNIKFESLDDVGVNNQLLNHIFSHNMYELRPEMIQLIAKHVKGNIPDDIGKKYYTTILEMPYEPLLKYIRSDISNYMENVELLGDNKYETNQAVVALLDYNIDSKETCKIFLEQQIEVHFEHFYDCYEDAWEEHLDTLRIIWDTLLEGGKIEPLWDNVKQYYEKFKITPALISFLYKYVSNLPLISFTQEDGDQWKFIKDLVYSEYVSSEKLDVILDKININDDGGFIDAVDMDKLKILVKHKSIVFNFDNLDKILLKSDNGFDAALIFVEKNSEMFLNIQNNFDVKSHESFILHLLDSDIFTDQYKYSITECMSDNDITENIAKHIASNVSKIPQNIFMKICSYLDEKSIEKLMLQNLDKLSIDDFDNLFERIGGKYSGFVEKGAFGHVRLSYTEKNWKLAKRLEEVGYISSSKLEDKKKSIRMIIKKRR